MWQKARRRVRIRGRRRFARVKSVFFFFFFSSFLLCYNMFTELFFITIFSVLLLYVITGPHDLPERCSTSPPTYFSFDANRHSDIVIIRHKSAGRRRPFLLLHRSFDTFAVIPPSFISFLEKMQIAQNDTRHSMMSQRRQRVGVKEMRFFLPLNNTCSIETWTI